MSSHLNASIEEVEAAQMLSDIVYSPQPVHDSQALQTFKDRFSVLALLSLCTKSGQKYTLSICQPQSTRVLFCAFAGTHIEGDWTNTNFHLFHNTDKREFGTSGHAGFLNRAIEVPLEGIGRVAREAMVHRIIFCGHSLGGAISHVCRLRWLNSLSGDIDEYGKDKVVSIAIGAPFVGGTDMREHIKRHAWLDGFITLVNGKDPVPRIMNLAASLINNTVSIIISSVIGAAVGQNIGGPNTAANILRAVKSVRGNSSKEIAPYLPIGQYVLFEQNGDVSVSSSTTEVSQLLGAAQLFREDPNILQGMLNHDTIAQHDVHAYHNIIKAKKGLISRFFIKQDSFRSTYGSQGSASQSYVRSRTQWAPVVHEIQCETLIGQNEQPVRVIKIVGNNLDFVGDKSLEVDIGKLDTEWSSRRVSQTNVCRRTDTILVLHQYLKYYAEEIENKKIQAQPKYDLEVQVRSDMILDGTGPAQYIASLPRIYCCVPEAISEDPIRFYEGGQFFLDTQQISVVMKNLFGDNALETQLQELETRLKRIFPSLKYDLLKLSKSWKGLDSVGQPDASEDSSEVHTVEQCRVERDRLYRSIVPPDGLQIRTKKQEMGAYAAVVTCTVIGGGIIYIGGLGIIGPYLGLAGSATGGYGTAATITSAGSSVALMLYDRLQSNYHAMLEDLYKIYSGTPPRTMTEMKLEAALLSAESNYNGKNNSGEQQSSNITMFHQYDKNAQKVFTNTVSLVHVIHEIKKERLKGTLVTICGPRDSGKTTLVSQLLQEPKRALDTGLGGDEQETRKVTPYNLKYTGVDNKVQIIPNIVLLDTPGLTGPEAHIRSRFDAAALNLSSTFVYIRQYAGLPTMDDLDAVSKILECAARLQAPNILICLNECRYKLTRNAAGQMYRTTAMKEKKKWLDRFNQLRSKNGSLYPAFVNMLWSKCQLNVEFVELDGDKSTEIYEFGKDPRLKGVWTCHSIGCWIAKVTAPPQGKPKEAWEQFKAHLEGFDHKVWATEYQRLYNEREEER